MLLARWTIRDASTRVFGEAMIPRDPLTYGMATRIRKDGANAKRDCLVTHRSLSIASEMSH
jgi:hypothetical protein